MAILLTPVHLLVILSSCRSLVLLSFSRLKFSPSRPLKFPPSRPLKFSTSCRPLVLLSSCPLVLLSSRILVLPHSCRSLGFSSSRSVLSHCSLALFVLSHFCSSRRSVAAFSQILRFSDSRPLALSLSPSSSHCRYHRILFFSYSPHILALSSSCTRRSVALSSFRIVVLSHCRPLAFPFPRFLSWSFSQLVVLSVGRSLSWSFSQLVVLSHSRLLVPRVFGQHSFTVPSLV